MRLQVDLGQAVPLGSIAITRPDVLAIAAGETSVEDHAVTKPVRSASATVSVSADGRSWRRPSRGSPVRYVRVTAGADASQRKPLVIGELIVRR